jgi:hypothetical protein
MIGVQRLVAFFLGLKALPSHDESDMWDGAGSEWCVGMVNGWWAFLDWAWVRASTSSVMYPDVF